MSEGNIQGIMDVTLEKLRAMVDADTIIGTPVKADNFTLIPVSKVSFGLATGSDFPSKSGAQMFGGGSGAGASVVPVAFIAINGDEIKMLPVYNDLNTFDKAINMMPDLIEKAKGLFKRQEIRFDEDGNVIASFVDDNQQMLQMQCLSDGNAILDFYDVDAGTHAWGIYNSKLELVKELPKLTEDAGHGETKDFDIESINKVLGNRAFVNYKNGVKKVLDLDTMELSDLEDRNYLFSDSYHYKLVGKYFWDAGTLFDAELYKTYDYIFQDYDAIFVTDKNFYYAADNNLYRYVNENEGELVYDGSASKSNYGAVSEDHFIVYDDAGTFLVDMATGEEHKITLNE